MFVPVWFTHAWSTGEGDLLGAYLHCTATTPFETVCKQFINGSVPFGYSLNSGFDTGNDSWFSSGAWQVGTPVQKMPAGTGALWVGESRGPRGLGYHFLLGLALWGRRKNNRKKKNSPCTLQKAEEENESVHKIGGRGHSIPSSDVPSHMHTLTYSVKLWMGGGGQGGLGWRRSFQILVKPCYSQHKRGPHRWPRTSSPASRKKDARYKPITPLSWKRQSTSSTRSCYELAVSSPKRDLSVAGEMVSVR